MQQSVSIIVLRSFVTSSKTFRLICSIVFLFGSNYLGLAICKNKVTAQLKTCIELHNTDVSLPRSLCSKKNPVEEQIVWTVLLKSRKEQTAWTDSNAFVLLSVLLQSRHMSYAVYVLLTGFGFLTFEHEDSVNLVVNEHFIQIAGKQVVLDSSCCGGRENHSDI